MKFGELFVLCFVVLSVFLPLTQGGHSRFFKPKKLEPKPKPKPPKINVDLLPDFVGLLEELSLSKYLQKFIRLGVTETQHLLKLGDMDFRIMSMEWEILDEELRRLREHIPRLWATALIPEVELRPEIEERKKIKYGRVYLNNGVQTFEYLSASFGGPPPIGPLNFMLGDPLNGCSISESVGDLSQKMYVVQRGGCSFLAKATVARAANVSVLVIINNEDRLESPSSGLGIDPNITESSVKAMDAISVIALSNTTLAKFTFAGKFTSANGMIAHVVPLKCAPGGKCAPLLEEEKVLPGEITAGVMRVTNNNQEVKSFEFLTSTFGSLLPAQLAALPLVSLSSLSPTFDACEPLVDLFAEKSISVSLEGKAVLVNRGGCRFDVKAHNIEKSGARLMIVVDRNDSSLQRLGGLMPESGFVGIPSVFTSLPFVEFIESGAQRINSGNDLATEPTDTQHAVLEITPYITSEVADRWIDVAYTDWADDDELRLMQLEGLLQKYAQQQNHDIVAWLKRQSDAIKSKFVSIIATDEL